MLALAKFTGRGDLTILRTDARCRPARAVAVLDHDQCWC
jgi:hypothetical protein